MDLTFRSICGQEWMRFCSINRCSGVDTVKNFKGLRDPLVSLSNLKCVQSHHLLLDLGYCVSFYVCVCMCGEGAPNKNDSG